MLAVQITQPSTQWWSQTGSNRRPPACKAGALPAELWPREHQGFTFSIINRLSMVSHLELSASYCTTLRTSGPTAEKMVGLGSLELPPSRLSSARSNQLSYRPDSLPRVTHKINILRMRVYHYCERDTKTAFRRRAPTGLNRQDFLVFASNPKRDFQP